MGSRSRPGPACALCVTGCQKFVQKFKYCGRKRTSHHFCRSLARSLVRALCLSLSKTHTHRCNVATSLTRLLVATAVLFCLACFLHSPTFVWRALCLFRIARARSSLSLSLFLTHAHMQIYTHKHKHKHKLTTGARNSERSYAQRDFMLSFTRAMSLSCVLARTLYA